MRTHALIRLIYIMYYESHRSVHRVTFPREWMPCSIRIEKMTKTAQTSATAHVAVSLNVLSPAAAAAMPS
jgi:hypothetical protein